MKYQESRWYLQCFYSSSATRALFLHDTLSQLPPRLECRAQVPICLEGQYFQSVSPHDFAKKKLVAETKRLGCVMTPSWAIRCGCLHAIGVAHRTPYPGHVVISSAFVEQKGK